MPTLQRLIIPALDVCREVGLYLRLAGPVTLDVENRQVVMRAGGELRTDTFFGVFSVATWLNKSTVRRIGVKLEVSGSFTVDTMVTALDGHEQLVDRRTIDDGTEQIELPDLGRLGAGLLWFRLTCGSAEGRVRGLEVVTPDRAAREVDLGVAITTYNRMPYVAANVARLGRLFKEDPETAEKVSVLIIDNASDLQLEVRGALPVEIVHNPNLGGAGGFARGLWEHRRRGQATHVLFMDDDIAFEPEIIARTVAFLCYAADEDVCVAGSMMRMDQPAVQFEAGANCNPAARSLWQPLGRGQNLLYTDVLLDNERAKRFDYGAWWYFAFPLDTTEAYPPPLFVRGDDVFWGVRHTSGRAITMNGIGVWHADFDQKNGPASAFYESRNVAIIKSLAYPDHTAGELRRRLGGVVLRILSFRYDWAEAALDGIDAFLDGPEALMQADPMAVHERLRSRYRSETLRALGEDEMILPEVSRPTMTTALVLGPLTLMTLGGNLLPRLMRRRGRAAVFLQRRASLETTFRDELVYRLGPTAEGFTARRDRRRAMSLLRRTWRVARRVTATSESVSAAYRKAEPEMTSAAFWERKFEDPASR